MQLFTGGPNRLKISLLIPFFNEEQQIPLTLATVIPILESTGYDFELVLVDDGSRDQTWQVISQLAGMITGSMASASPATLAKRLLSAPRSMPRPGTL